MSATMNRTTEHVFQFIESEQRRDRFVRRISVVAWSVTFLMLLAFASLVAFEVSHAYSAVEVGAATIGNVLALTMPLIAVTGVLSVLIATVSTVGVFLRLRTASLAEIQVRLAALEQMLLEGEVR